MSGLTESFFISDILSANNNPPEPPKKRNTRFYHCSKPTYLSGPPLYTICGFKCIRKTYDEESPRTNVLVIPICKWVPQKMDKWILYFTLK